MAHTRDEGHWLHRLSAAEWIQAALVELGHAEAAYARGDARAGLAGCKRAAGMALNGALIVEPNESWGRTYVDHVRALSTDEGAPVAVRDACRALLEEHAPGGALLSLRSRKSDARVIEAAKDVMAHAYAKVKKHET